MSDWLDEEQERAGKGAKTGAVPNQKATLSPKPKSTRKTKAFQVDQERSAKWDRLVATMKNDPANKKTGPDLIDEALDHLFKKYAKNLGN